MSAHPGELMLRRLRAGELLGVEAHDLEGHLEGCSRCRARIKNLEQEQEEFEREISFDRFAARVQRSAKSAAPRPTRWIMPAMGVAAAVVVAIVVSPLIDTGRIQSGSRSKGGARVTLRIGGTSTGTQRVASAQVPTPLGTGERVRIGYQAGGHRYLVAISIDEQKTVTELYGQSGSSLQIGGGEETRYLPDSVEFTGNGLERVIVILSDEPLELERVKREAERAYDAARGDLRQLVQLDVPGEQFHRLLLKP